MSDGPEDPRELDWIDRLLPKREGGQVISVSTASGMNPFYERMYMSHDDPKVLGWHRGDWMQTFTGRRFYPLDPRPEEIDPVDIAHALSLLCRYGGHVDRFYSVAEHCLLMADAVAPENALHALLHDATEAYVCDVPRPLKRQLAGYGEIERRVWLAITTRFGISEYLPPEVKNADNAILLTEREALMRNAERWPLVDGSYTPLPVRIHAMPPPDAERYYLAYLRRLAPDA